MLLPLVASHRHKDCPGPTRKKYHLKDPDRMLRSTEWG